MRKPLASVVFAVVSAGVLAGCTSSSGSSAESSTNGWTTPEAALAALKAAGFACPWTGQGEQLIVAGQMPSPAASGAQAPTQSGVRCDGYAVALIESKDAWIADLGTGCAPITQAQADAPEAAAPFVLGADFVMMGLGTAGAFPADASPEALAKAFDGEQTTMLGLYKKACGDGIVTPGSAGPSPAAS